MIRAQWQASTNPDDLSGLAIFYKTDIVRETTLRLESFADFGRLLTLMDIQEYNAAEQAKSLLKARIESVLVDVL